MTALHEPKGADVIDLNARRQGTPAARVSGAPGALADRDDDALMLLARGGLPQAFDTLVTRYQHRVLRIAARYLADASLACDVSQNAFVELHRALPSYRPQGKLWPYLQRILLNQCRMAGRTARAAGRADSPLLASVGATTGESAEEVILARERRAQVDRAMASLSPKLREVVVLRFAGDLKLAEIAEVLELPVGTVKRRLFDALLKLRQSLEG